MSHDDRARERRFPKPFYSHESSVERPSMDSRRDLASYSSDKSYSDVGHPIQSSPKRYVHAFGT